MKKKSLKRLRNIFIALIVIVSVAYIFRAPIYRASVNYKEDGGRKNYKVKDKNLATFIEGNLPQNQGKDIESIIDISQKLTEKALDFSSDSKENDPNKTVLLKRANRTGYAAFTAATGNYLIEKYKLSEVWEAKPVKGKLYIFGYDINKTIKDKDFKDHDFVVFKNKVTKKEISVDPTINEKFGINRITKQ